MKNTKSLGYAVALGVIFILFVFHHGIGGDATVRYLGLEELLNQGKIPNMKYSLIGPLFSAPLFWLGHLIKDSFWWTERFNAVYFACFVLFAWKFLKDRWDKKLLLQFLLLLLTASMLAKHSEEYYGELFTVLSVCAGSILMAYGRFGWGASFTILGTMNTPASLVGLGCMALVFLFRKRKLRYAALPFAALIAMLLENKIRKGAFLATGYEVETAIKTIMPYSGDPGFTYPFLFGLLAITLSFGKGIFYYSSGILFPVKKAGDDKQQLLYLSWIAYTVGIVLTYSKWWAWHGDRFWGPRYYLFSAIPAAFALAHYLTNLPKAYWLRSLLLLGVTMSFWVGASGVVFGLANLEPPCGKDQHLCWFIPEFSALWRVLVIPPNLKLNDIVTLTFFFACYVLSTFELYKSLFIDGLATIKKWWQTYAKIDVWKW